MTCPTLATAPPPADCDPEAVAWSEWSPCTASCNTGYTSRSKMVDASQTCHIHVPSLSPCHCLGWWLVQMVEERVCNPERCPAWGSWDDWSFCAVNCTHPRGVQRRRRSCEWGEAAGWKGVREEGECAGCTGTRRGSPGWIPARSSPASGRRAWRSGRTASSPTPPTSASRVGQAGLKGQG